MGKTTLKIFKGITFFNNKYKFFPHSFIKYCLRDQTSPFSPYENGLLLVPPGAYDKVQNKCTFDFRNFELL